MIEYFEKRAHDYQERSGRGLWAHVRRLEFNAVVELLAPRTGQRLLELGCGAGYYSLQLREKFALNILAVDSSPRMLDGLAGTGIDTWLGEAHEVPEDNRFDAVLAAGLLEFVERPAEVLKKAARVLDPGGKLILLIPAAGLRGTLYARVHQWQGCPVFIREAAEYVRLASACGFELHQRRNCTPISIAMEFRRRP